MTYLQGRRANKKAVKEEYNRLSDPGYAAKMRSKDREEVMMFFYACTIFIFAEYWMGAVQQRLCLELTLLQFVWDQICLCEEVN